MRDLILELLSRDRESFFEGNVDLIIDLNSYIRQVDVGVCGSQVKEFVRENQERSIMVTLVLVKIYTDNETES